MGTDRPGAWRLDKARPEDNNFTVTVGTAVADTDIGTRALMDLCLSENDCRFAGYDPRLCRPRTMPNLVRCARRFMR